MASITTFNGLRCTKLLRTDIFTTATLTSDAAAQSSATEPLLSSSVETESARAGPPASTTIATTPSTNPSPNPSPLLSNTAAVASSNTVGNAGPVAASATALPAQAGSAGGVGTFTPSPQPSSGANRPNIRAAIGGSLGSIVVVALAFLMWYLLRRRRHRIPRQPVDFYAGEKLDGSDDRSEGGTTPEESGERKQQLQEITAGMVAPLVATAQVMRKATSQLKSRLSSTMQTMRNGSTRFKSKMRGSFPVIRLLGPPWNEVEPSETEVIAEDDSRAERQRRLSNPFADHRTSSSVLEDVVRDPNFELPENKEDPFADPKNPFQLDLPPGLGLQPQQGGSSNQDNIDSDSQHISPNIGTNGGTGNSPSRASSWYSIWWKRESGTRAGTGAGTGTDTRPTSTRSDPFDLERPPTIYGSRTAGAGTATGPGANRLTRGRSILSRNSRMSISSIAEEDS